MSLLKYILLRPISLVYGLVISLRNLFYDLGIFRSHSFALPVICVGNITAGGTGKTPHVIYISGLLSQYIPVAVLSRGYLRTSRGFRIVQRDDSVYLTGDEPLQVAHTLPDIRVVVDRNRVHGIREIVKLFPDTRAVILDDGFQHRSLKAGMNIVLTSHSRLMTRDHLLPYGRLRESVKAIKRADLIIVTKTPEGLSIKDTELIKNELKLNHNQNLFFTSLAYEQLKPLYSGVREREIRKDTGVVLVTGIADPSPLVDYVSGLTSSVKHLAYPDHHNFTLKDIEGIILAFNELQHTDKIIVTTEKDSVRIKEFTIIEVHFKEVLFYLPVRISFVEKEEEFIKIVTEYARKNH